MPIVDGKIVPPRVVIQSRRKAQNPRAVALYLVMDWLLQEAEANGQDWDAILSDLREMRGEPRGLRQDNIPGGYQGMCKLIDSMRLKDFKAGVL
jgi:hypothetical protein